MAKNESEGRSITAEKERPTTDELEILKIVIAENQGLKSRVIKKIKTHLASSKMSVLDTASEKDKKRKKKKRRNDEEED